MRDDQVEHSQETSSQVDALILGEYRRTLDDRYRLSLPSELLVSWTEREQDLAVLAKERPGCLSLWQADRWQKHLDSGVTIIRNKLQSGRLNDRVGELQAFGRLLSTRHRTVKLAGRGRLVIPEGFREFLAADAGTEVIVVGAAVCIEIWTIAAWQACLAEQIPQFSALLDDLSG